jgi:hypothetical protein
VALIIMQTSARKKMSLCFYLVLCFLAIVVGCGRPAAQSELVGSYEADYAFAKEDLTLMADGRFTQKVSIKSTSQVLVTNATWTFDSDGQRIVFHDSFFKVLDGFGNPLTHAEPGTASLPVVRWRGRLQIGDSPTIEYKKQEAR